MLILAIVAMNLVFGLNNLFNGNPGMACLSFGCALFLVLLTPATDAEKPVQRPKWPPDDVVEEKKPVVPPPDDTVEK